MKIVALVVAILIGLFLSPATGQDSDDEPPGPVLICPTDYPRCDLEDR